MAARMSLTVERFLSSKISEEEDVSSWAEGNVGITVRFEDREGAVGGCCVRELSKTDSCLMELARRLSLPDNSLLAFCFHRGIKLNLLGDVDGTSGETLSPLPRLSRLVTLAVNGLFLWADSL